MRGMSLIEVLVALVILSVGLLGIAQLLIHGMRTSHAALLRTQAVNLVADMAERIRANPGERADDDWLASVAALLPLSSGGVEVVDDSYRVSVSWLEPGESQPFTEQAAVVVAP
jgi:prepilin-type N-terminal cleavage/methylation domain-containing protein